MQEIYIGVDHPSYTKFDDGEVLGAYPFPHLVSRIDVEFNETHVIGVNVTYKCGNGQFVCGQSSLKFKNTPVIVKSFIVPEGDFISEIFGTFENVINSLGFVTYKGLRETFGNPIGVQFRHFSPKNTFTAAKGSVGKWLNFITFRVVPLPSYAMQQFYPTPGQYPPQQQYPTQQPYPPQQQYPPPQYPQQQPYPPYPQQQYPQGYPQPYPYPTYQPPPVQQTTVVEVIDTNPYGGGYNAGYNNYYQKQGMGMGAALGMGMLTGMAISDLTHPHHHHGGIYDVNVYGGHHHHHHH